MYEVEWLKERYHYSELKYSKISSILYFGIIWSIFEKNVFDNNATINQSGAKSSDLAMALNAQDKRKLTLIWNYFVDRYTENGVVKESFQYFRFHDNDRRDLVKRCLSKGAAANYPEKSEAIMRIVFRLRNNLLHGEKDVSNLYGQNNNFKYANKFLILCIEKIS